MNDDRDNVCIWIAREIVPHEPAIRASLSRRWGHVIEVEDVIQEAYCRVSELASLDHIENPPGYFHRTANAVATDIMRRAGIIDFTSVSQIDLSNVMDNKPLADRALEASQELEWVSDLVSKLPDTYRKVIELRRIEGLSRKDTAERLGINESEVKNCLARGLQKVIRAMADRGQSEHAEEPDAVERKVEVIGTRRIH